MCHWRTHNSNPKKTQVCCQFNSWKLHIRPYVISQTSTELSPYTDEDQFSWENNKLSINIRTSKRERPSDEALDACEDKALKETENKGFVGKE